MRATEWAKTMARRVANKYRAVRTLYDGVWYATRLEARVARWLDYMIEAGEVRSWERQVKIPIVIEGETFKSPRIDFLVTFKDGHREFYEAKGRILREWKMLRGLLEITYFRHHPELLLRIIFKEDVPEWVQV